MLLPTTLGAYNSMIMLLADDDSSAARALRNINSISIRQYQPVIGAQLVSSIRQHDDRSCMHRSS